MRVQERTDCWALVPLKAPEAGKSRLAPVLDASERARLVRAMFTHVLDVLRRTEAVDRIAVVTPEPGALPPDVHGLRDAGKDVNEALTLAAHSIQAQGAGRLVVLPADLPFLQPGEIAALIEASEPQGFAIAPDHRECGTNALCLALPADFRFHFGVDSFARHLAEAAALGRTPVVVRRPGLAFDVDEPADLAHLRSQAGDRFGRGQAMGI